MSEEKKTAVTEEVKEEVRKLTEEELEQVNGGAKGGGGMAIFQDFSENILAGQPASASIFVQDKNH